MADDGKGSTADSSENKVKLTDAQRANIERSRQKALLIKQQRQSARSFANAKNDPGPKAKRVVDTHGGFLLEMDEEKQKKPAKVIHQPGVILDSPQLMCDECGKEFIESWLHNTFQHEVCDKCRDQDEKHKLITKSEAKAQYLLKDADLEKREPPLKFIAKKNPHKQQWGEMKLFLECQVAARAQELWGTDEALEEERERRLENRDKAKQKKFDKKVTELRRAVRSSLWRKETSGHEHVYGEETYDEEEDMYSKTCTTCDHVTTYEKM